MKRSITLLALIAATALSTAALAQDFDAKLKRFILVDDGKYIPELTCDEAVKLGFTVNDFNRYVAYVEQLNQHDAPALTRPENLFLASYLEVQNNKLVLTIPLEKALRAGATVEGYLQTMEFVNEINHESAMEWEKLRDYLTQCQAKSQAYAHQHPDSSAVQHIFRSGSLSSTR